MELEFWKNLNGFLQGHALIVIWKSFIQTHLALADNVYDQPNNLNLCRGSTKEKLY